MVQHNSARKLQIMHKIEEYFNDLVVNLVEGFFLCFISDLMTHERIRLDTKAILENDIQLSAGITAVIIMRFTKKTFLSTI